MTGMRSEASSLSIWSIFSVSLSLSASLSQLDTTKRFLLGCVPYCAWLQLSSMGNIHHKLDTIILSPFCTS